MRGQQSTVSVTHLKRIINAARKANFNPNYVTVAPDGSITLSCQAEKDRAADIFDIWKDRL